MVAEPCQERSRQPIGIDFWRISDTLGRSKNELPSRREANFQLRIRIERNVENHRFWSSPGGQNTPRNPTHNFPHFCRLYSNKLEQESRTHPTQLQLALAAFRQLILKLWTFLHEKNASGAMSISTWEGPGAHFGPILVHF